MGCSRSPHGERGLKYDLRGVALGQPRSLPSRGAWIEISRSPEGITMGCRSLPSRGAWIEIRAPHVVHNVLCRSLPSRGAWIEIR